MPILGLLGPRVDSLQACQASSLLPSMGLPIGYVYVWRFSLAFSDLTGSLSECSFPGLAWADQVLDDLGMCWIHKCSVYTLSGLN